MVNMEVLSMRATVYNFLSTDLEVIFLFCYILTITEARFVNNIYSVTVEQYTFQ